MAIFHRHKKVYESLNANLKKGESIASRSKFGREMC